MGALVTQLGPLLQGTQVGQVLGFLATRVLGQYDVAVPRQAGTGALLFVISNIARFEHDWSLDPTEFRTSVAIHEVTHRLEVARPWTSTHFVSLVDDFLSTLTVDVGAIQERLSSLDPTDTEAVERALGGEGDDALFGAVLDDEQRIKLVDPTVNRLMVSVNASAIDASSTVTSPSTTLLSAAKECRPMRATARPSASVGCSELIFV